jgi:hypothetical protein
MAHQDSSQPQSTSIPVKDVGLSVLHEPPLESVAVAE